MLVSANKRKMGSTAENKACEYLVKQGLTLVVKNYFCALGEIDLIMRDGEELVFIEVRSRHKLLDDAIESIDQYKQSKIIKSATFYLQKNHLTNETHCRFDVIAMTQTDVQWIKNAFTLDNY